MASLLLAPIVEVFRLILAPIAPFTWLGLPFSALDTVAALRLCVALRQFREKLARDHALTLKTMSGGDPEKEKERAAIREMEQRSFVRDAAATLVVVYGGEAVMAPALSILPSFMYSGAVPAFYTGMQALVEWLPVVPAPTLELEFPLALFDGLSRAFLLCDLIPPMVTAHALPAIRENPWTLLLTSLMTANGGFFLTNLLSFFQPYPLTLTTPTELLPGGWTTTDLWCAPLVTGLYAFLTHAQPFWADAHGVALGLLGLGVGVGGEGEAKVAAVDTETARAVCAVVLMGLFATRAVRNFAPAAARPKTKVQ